VREATPIFRFRKDDASSGFPKAPNLMVRRNTGMARPCRMDPPKHMLDALVCTNRQQGCLASLLCGAAGVSYARKASRRRARTTAAAWRTIDGTRCGRPLTPIAIRGDASARADQAQRDANAAARRLTLLRTSSARAARARPGNRSVARAQNGCDPNTVLPPGPTRTSPSIPRSSLRTRVHPFRPG